jgi:hypothetical protein
MTTGQPTHLVIKHIWIENEDTAAICFAILAGNALMSYTLNNNR